MSMVCQREFFGGESGVFACGKSFDATLEHPVPCVRRRSISVCFKVVRHSPDGRHVLDLDASVEENRRRGEACCLTDGKTAQNVFLSLGGKGRKRHHTLQ